MPKKRVREWFVRADAKTNEVVARRLNDLQVAEESMAMNIVVKISENKFEKFSAWQVPHAFITDLEKSKSAFKFLKFSIYRRWQGQDFAQLWIFGEKNKSAKVVKAIKDLKVLKKKKGIAS
jgi:hypothetical protein